MRIRAHVLWLVTAAVLPVMIFSAVMTVVFWRQQRTLFEDRFLERVRAVSIALDRDHEASIAALRGLAESWSLAGGDLERFRAMAEQTLKGEQSWSSVILAHPGGRPLVQVPGPRAPALPSLQDSAVFQQVVRTREPVISGLINSVATGRYATCLALPVLKGGDLQSVLVVEIDQKAWLQFLSL